MAQGYRQHLYLTTDHPNENKIGRVEFREEPRRDIEKNEEGVVGVKNKEEGYTYQYNCVGLGYHDFESKEEAEDLDNCFDVIEEKFTEIDDEWLEIAGLEDG